MGGGQKVKQTNPAQAAAANAAATGAATQAQNQGKTFSAQQQQLYNLLYGGPGGKGGALTGLLDPKSLEVTKPTGVYALQNTNANTAAAKQYAANEGDIKLRAAEAGFNPATTPAGFVQDQLNRNARALADTRGQNFSDATARQYQDVLQNFWKAANITAGGAAETGSQANQATGTAANTYQNLYGTAGHGNVVSGSNWLAPIMGAAGTVGAAALGPGGAATAACCAEGTLIRTGRNESTRIEKLFEGAEVFGLPENDDDPLVIRRPLAYAMKPCVQVKTDGGQELVCSTDHTLLLAGGGYVAAEESLGHSVRTRGGSVKVREVRRVGEHRVVRLHLDAPHVFESNGLLSEE